MSTPTLPTVLENIVARKQKEIRALHARFSLSELENSVKPANFLFSKLVAEKRNRNEHFFVTEFKRRSPSNPSISLGASPQEMAKEYIGRGTTAISVLTDQEGFGGSFADMEAISYLAKAANVAVLNKDFILDTIQVLLARKYGADIILLIAAILSDEQILHLYETARKLGMDAIAEVHTQEEKARILSLGLPIIGINNRDLHSFQISLNTTNALAYNIPTDRTVIAESGMEQPIDFAICGMYAHGFLVGTSLMQGLAGGSSKPLVEITRPRYFFKACGIRQAQHVTLPALDLVGINTSPKSKRKADIHALGAIPAHAVALFYGNETEMATILAEHSFRWIQSYVPLHTLSKGMPKVKRIRAFKSLPNWKEESVWQDLAASDLIILDGAQPGSGDTADYSIPEDFPFPFLLAGGINLQNIRRVQNHKRCIGVDIASGIEENEHISTEIIQKIYDKLNQLKR